MTLIRWQPYQDLNTLTRQLDRLLDDAFLFPNTERRNRDIMSVPAVEIQETDEAVLVNLEIPGIDAKDLDIQVTTDAVYISGERKSEAKTEEKGVIRSEFRYGKFQRVIPLPAHIQNTNVTADLKDGVLNLTLPKTTEEKNKVVKVELN